MVHWGIAMTAGIKKEFSAAELSFQACTYLRYHTFPHHQYLKVSGVVHFLLGPTAAPFRAVSNPRLSSSWPSAVTYPTQVHVLTLLSSSCLWAQSVLSTYLTPWASSPQTFYNHHWWGLLVPEFLCCSRSCSTTTTCSRRWISTTFILSIGYVTNSLPNQILCVPPPIPKVFA